MLTEIVDEEKESKEKWINDSEYNSLIVELKKTCSTLGKTKTNDPKLNMLKIRIAELVKQHRAWQYMNSVVGMSYTIGGLLLSQIDVLKIHYVSQIYSYCGISVHKKPYKSFLKKVLMIDLSERFIQMDSEYALYYYKRILFLLNRDGYQITTGEISEPHTIDHIRNMAKRYMIQKFLRDFYEASRTLMDIPLINGCIQKYGGTRSTDDAFDWKSIVESDVNPKLFKIRRVQTRKQIRILKEKIKSACLD